MIKKAMMAMTAGVTALALSGCVSMLDNAWDDAAHAQCDEEARAHDRLSCHDRVDDYSRERDRED